MSATIAMNTPAGNPQINAQQQATIVIDATVTTNDGTLHGDCEAYYWCGPVANDPGAAWPGSMAVTMGRDAQNAAHWTSLPQTTGMNGNFRARVWVRVKETPGNASGDYSVINGM